MVNHKYGKGSSRKGIYKPQRIIAEEQALKQARRQQAALQQAAPTGPNPAPTGPNPAPAEPKAPNPEPRQTGGTQDRVPPASRGGFQRSNRGGFKGPFTKPLDRGAPKPAADLKKVHEAQKVEVSDRLGRTMTRLVNTSVGGGNSTQWVADSNDGGFWGVGMDPQSVVYLMERLKKESKSSSFGFHLIPNNPEMFDDVANNAVQKRVVNNSGRTDDGKPQGLPPVEGSLNQAKAEEDCPYCDRKGHALVDCFCKYPKGELFGCVCCNSKEHLADDCMLFRSMNLAEKVDWLVVKRANKPPVHTAEPWYVTLHKYCMSESFDREAFRGFPWTIEFARKIYKGVPNSDTLTTRQRKFDEARKKIKPLVDPLTRGFEEVSSTYWQPLGLPWPNAFKSKDVVSQDVNMLSIDDLQEDDAIESYMNQKAPSPEPEPYGDEQEDDVDFN